MGLRQPIRYGGLGVRGMRDTVPVAFIGALEQTIPSFRGDHGVCEQLSHLVAEPGNEDNRWQPLLQSGCRTGTELAFVWESLTKEARESADFLNQDVDKIFLVSVEGVGDGKTDGKTRSQLMESREKVRGQALTRALELHHDRQARPALMWPQLDKLSNSWLLALPGPQSGLSGPVFSEGMCSLLCIPSPACRDRVGESVGRGTVVDRFGDRVMSAPLPGDTWRAKHDEIKSAINGLCLDVISTFPFSIL